MILLIDNYDSFTWNLYHLIASLDHSVLVVRNDALSVDEVLERRPEAIVLGAGPGRPREAGICMELIDRLPPQLAAQTPIWVRFHYAANGRLAVSVKVGDNGTEVTHRIQRSAGLTPEQLEAWRQWVVRVLPG